MILKARGVSPPLQLFLGKYIQRKKNIEFFDINFFFKVVLLLSCFWTQVLAQTLYSVIINSPETDAGVVIDNELYLLTPSKKSEIVLQTKAPGGRRYFYAKLKKNTTEIVDQEPFLRNPVTQRWTFNEFYGRNWNAKQVVNFQPVSEIANNFNREDDFDLHPVGEIATIHVIAPQADITKMHDRFLDDLDIRVDITHIRYIPCYIFFFFLTFLGGLEFI